MQTLTITNAKKNLGRLLQAAARGEDIGIVSGACIIALRKVEVESVDYAQREYGATNDHLEDVERATDRRFEKLKRAGKLTITTHGELRELLKKPLVLDPDVLKRLGQLPKSERAECLQALCDLCEAFGRPHVHSGVGIRKLGGHLFECRGNLELRFVFQDRPDSLYVRLLGDHAEVRQFLRTGKY